MFRPVLLSLVLLVPAPSAPPALAAPSVSPAADAFAVTAAAPALPEMASALALPRSGDELAFGSGLRLPGRHRQPRAARPVVETMPLGPERARVLLRSLTLPGWGQATVGRRHAAAVFGTAELGIWTAFTSFRVQELLRRQGYERTAQIFAGIDLKGRDEEYRRIVGAFANSDEYNLYVVARDAANLYMTDPYHPDLPSYRAYVAAHSISGSNAWAWQDRASFDRYREQRKNEQRAAMRANTALGFAIANRLVSALHAMRASSHIAPAPPKGTSWRFEVTPGDPAEPTAVRAGLHASF